MSASQAPDSLDMPLNVIPASVPANGPHFIIFPNEVLLEIFKYMVTCTSARGQNIDVHFFGIINRAGAFGKLCRVSKHFAHLAKLAFYEANQFTFRWLDEGKGINTPLPPIYVRHFARRIQVHFWLKDIFLTEGAEYYKGTELVKPWVRHPIKTVEELFRNCPAARQLHELTNAATGFDRLEVLDLRITEVFSSGNGLEVYRAAGISVTAKEVKITITDRNGYCHPWHNDLEALIRGQ